MALSLRGHGSPISDALLMPTGSHRMAVSSSTDGAVKLWDASGAVAADLLLPLAAGTPPQPVPLSPEYVGGGSLRRVYCGRDAHLVGVDMETEVVVASVPTPEQGLVLDLASASAYQDSGASGGLGGLGSSLLASCCHASGVVHLWDTRLLPADVPADATFDTLSAAARRCHAATLPLPRGGVCARQLYLDGARLLVSVDGDQHAAPFSRGAQEAALYDVRAAGAAGASEPLWTQRVRGDISCFQCRGDRVIVGTGTGAVHVWNFGHGRNRNSTGEMLDDGGEIWEPERRKKREKARADKSRRFPKTQGFSNARGFSR